MVRWQVLLFDTASGKELGTIEIEGARNNRFALHCAFSPDSKMLAVSEDDAQPKVELYEVPSAKRLRMLNPTPAALPPGGGGGPGGIQGGIGPGKAGFAVQGGVQGGGGKGKGGFIGGASAQQMLFSPDSKALAFQAFQAGPGATMVVLDTATGKQLGALPSVIEGSPATPGAFSPDRRCLGLVNSDGTVTLWELATGQPRRTYGSRLPLRTANEADLLLQVMGGGGPGGGGFVGDPVLSTTSGGSVAVSPDGKLLALPGPGGAVHVWDVLTGKELAALKGHTAAVNALAFAPDGKTLASASHDTTVLVWDIRKITRPAAPARVLRPGDLETWWQALADNDAAKAVAAMGEFVGVPRDAVAWIKGRVKPAAPLDRKRAMDLIEQLDDGRFKVRDRATAELLRIGDLLLPVLDKALADNRSPETHRRLEVLHAKITGPALHGDRLRDFRAVEVLERIGTPAARQVLRELAEGAPGALVTTSAQAALKR
jgi:hypothetical protein